jgi:hypothetical protein
MLDRRKTLSEMDCIKLDDLLLIQFQKFDWSNIHFIGNFFPMENNNEPNTLLLTRFLKVFIPNLSIAYPRINEIDLSMEFYEETESLQLNKWNHIAISYKPNNLDFYINVTTQFYRDFVLIYELHLGSHTIYSN